MSNFLLRSALACLVAAIVAGALTRPAPAESAENVLKLHVEPDVVDVPEPGLKGKRHWKVLATPKPEVFADEPFKSQLQREVDAALAETHPWISNPGSKWSFLSWLSRPDGPLGGTKLQFTSSRVEEPRGRPIVVLRPPQPADQGPVHASFSFTYVLTPMSRLRIAASSSPEPPGPGLAVKEIPLPADLLETVPEQDRQAVAAAVGFELRAKDAAFAPGEQERLLKVARHAFDIVRTQNALPPRSVVDDRTRQNVVLSVWNTLIPRPEPLKSAVRFEPVPGNPELWRLAVSNIVPIEAVRIEGRYDLTRVLAPDTKLSDQTKARLDKRAKEVSADLEEQFKADFDKQRGSVLTWPELEDAIKHMKVAAKDRIISVDLPEVEGGVLTYPIVIKPVVQSIDGTVGIGYNPREGVTGSAGLTTYNLLRWQDSGSFNLKGGPDTRRADLDYGIPLPSKWWNDDQRLRARVSLRGLYARTADTVLGQPRNAAVTEEEHGVFLRQSFMFLPLAPRGEGGPPPADADAPAASWRLSKSTALGLEAEIGRRDVELRGVAAPDGVPADGVTAPLSLTFRASSGFEPGDKTSGLVRSAGFRLESTFERSFGILGSDLRYERWDARAGVDGMFWLFSATPRNDLLLRYVHGYGTANAGTPLFRFLRVGGESNVRGMEEGELIGRRLQYQQLEVGVGVCSLQQLLFAKKATPRDGAAPGPPGAECQLGGLDLNRAFLKAFVDHADLTERAVGRQFLRGSRGIVGTGIALELHDLPVGNDLKLSLTIGYAYSPDSQRHASGTAFTSVIMPFALR